MRIATHINCRFKVNDPVLNDLLKLLFRNPKRRVNLIESIQEVLTVHS